MANSFSGNRIVLDTFTSAINVKTSRGDPSAHIYRVNFIEWQIPTAAAHTAVIVDDDGLDVFRETCTTANDSKIKYFRGGKVSNFVIATSGVSSGKILIEMAT